MDLETGPASIYIPEIEPELLTLYNRATALCIRRFMKGLD